MRIFRESKMKEWVPFIEGIWGKKWVCNLGRDIRRDR